MKFVLHNYSSDVELTLAVDISTSFVELQISGLKVSVDSMEKERDFYFSKLRDIEILCQRPELEHLPVREKKLNLIFMCLHSFTGFTCFAQVKGIKCKVPSTTGTCLPLSICNMLSCWYPNVVY